MKKIITLLLLLVTCAFQMDAQTFTVFSVQGQVDSLDNRGKAKSLIREKISVDSATCIKVNEESKVVLIDKANHRLYTINKPVQGPIVQLIYQKECSIKNLSKQYFAYLLKRLTKGEQKRPSPDYMGGTTSVFRGNDSIAHDSLAADSALYQEMRKDSIE